MFYENKNQNQICILPIKKVVKMIEYKKVTLDSDREVFFDGNAANGIDYVRLAAHYLKDYMNLCEQHNNGQAPLPENFSGTPISVEKVILFIQAIELLAYCQVPENLSEEPNLILFLQNNPETIYRVAKPQLDTP